ncbi:MAG TPA: hypothetical protein PKC19_09845 [Roseiflexaceae bacterium]|nr:hypothetical protein [Roseiflexaceae bacterium]
MTKQLTNKKREPGLFYWRRKARLSQANAGTYFGVSRDAVSDWENDVFVPEEDAQRRTKFITYLWELLALKHHPEEFDQI